MTFARKEEEEERKKEKKKKKKFQWEFGERQRRQEGDTFNLLRCSTDPDFKVKRIIKRWLFDAEEHFGASPFDPTSLLKRYISGFLQLDIADISIYFHNSIYFKTGQDA